jgi:hypothetical protein
VEEEKSVKHKRIEAKTSSKVNDIYRRKREKVSAARVHKLVSMVMTSSSWHLIGWEPCSLER